MKKSVRTELIARGCFVVRGQVLLCHSKGADNTYLPGGHIEFLESAADGLKREIREELGVEANVGAFLGAVEHTFVQKGKRHCEINLVFAFRAKGLNSRTPPPSQEKKIEFQWVPLGDLSRCRLEPAPLRRLLTKWIRAKADSGKHWASTYPKQIEAAHRPC